jgi:hypothetical protein
MQLLLNWLARFSILRFLFLALTACSSNDGEKEQGTSERIDFEKERIFTKVLSASISWFHLLMVKRFMLLQLIVILK